VRARAEAWARRRDVLHGACSRATEGAARGSAAARASVAAAQRELSALANRYVWLMGFTIFFNDDGDDDEICPDCLRLSIVFFFFFYFFF
jgi:hypothetical protein